MARGFEAIRTVVVNAPPAKVWDALTNPAKVKQYMHGTDMSTDWMVGSPIIWRGEWKGHSYVDKGTVLAFEPERLLRYTHSSPMGGTEACAPQHCRVFDPSRQPPALGVGSDARSHYEAVLAASSGFASRTNRTTAPASDMKAEFLSPRPMHLNVPVGSRWRRFLRASGVSTRTSRDFRPSSSWRMTSACHTASQEPSVFQVVRAGDVPHLRRCR